MRTARVTSFVVTAEGLSRRILLWSHICISNAGEARGVRRSVGFAPGVSDGVNGFADDAYRRDHKIQQYLVGIRIPFPSLTVTPSEGKWGISEGKWGMDILAET